MSFAVQWGRIGLAVLMVFGLADHAAAEADFTLTLDGEDFDLRVDTEATIKTRDGRTMTVKLSPRSVQSYQAKGIRFQHARGMSVASREIDRGVTQHMLTSATGTLLIVQVYDDLDPATLIDLMTREMTKDDVAAGATLETKPHQRMAQDGSRLAGTRSELKASKDDLVLEVLATARGRGGVLMITRHDNYTSPEDKDLVETFWKTVAFD